MATLEEWTVDEVIDQLDFDDGGFDYEWIGSTITYKFPTDVDETYSLDFGSGGAEEPGEEADAFSPIDAATAALFRIAIQLWDDLIIPNFVEITSGEADVEAAFTTTGIDFAHAYFPGDDENFPSPDGGTVWLNKNYNTEPNDLIAAPVGSYGFCTYLHELGHALGLDHMGNYTNENPGPFSVQDSTVLSVMSYFGPNGPYHDDGIEDGDWTVGTETYDVQTPMTNDVRAIQSMYGVSTTTRTGDTTYGFNATGLGNLSSVFDFTQNTHPVVCIFDSAGTDTLDLSGFTGNNVISLVPDTHSSVGNSGGGSSESNNMMTNNVSIAYSATIENAVSGSGNDFITGNTVANVITGGSGNDTISGGDGNDTMTGGLGNDSITGGDGNDTVVLSGNFPTYTITLNAVTSAWTLVSVATGTDVVSGVEFFQFADGVKTLAQLVGTDTTAPTLSSSSPADGGTNIDVNANITLTFSEAVMAGTGNITIFRSDGTPAHTIAAGDTSQLTFGTTNVTINPSADLDYNTGYYVHIDAGAIKDVAGNAYAGISNSTSLNFTTDPDDYTAEITTSGTITVGGGAATGGINFAGDEDFFKVALTAGQTYVFELRANGGNGLSDPELVLYNAQKAQQASDGDSAGGLDSRIVFQAATSGTYFLGANDEGTGTGAYTLTAVSATVVSGTPNNDSLIGSASLEVLRGFAGNDTLRGNGGNDVLEGGGGIDTAVYSAARSAYDVSIGASTTVHADSGSDGTDSLTGVERLRFSDTGLALDLDGNAGMVARTLGAVFGAAAVGNAAYARIGLDLVDGGMSFNALMELALGVVLGGAPSNAQVVALLYTNVIGTAPSAGELADFVGLLDTGVFTQAGIGVFAAQTPFNDAHIGMTGLQESGLAFAL